ncbi:ATP-dependent zinc metalloprotease FtsH, partial [bacterium]
GVPFFSTSASEFIEMFVGVGASRVRDLFAKARAKPPSIIFIDEIDAVGRHRGAGLGGGHDEREQTLNQLLSEMDGFQGHERVIIIAATNRPDVLDSALLRPGRFDRQVVIDLPSMEDREAILKVHTRKIPLADGVDLKVVARSTPGMSGADLENLCNEAALFAARNGFDKVGQEQFDLAKDKILMGLERPGLKSETERRITAVHESGHTLVASLIEGMDPVHKVTILPRGNALGVTQLLPVDDRHYYPKKYLMGRLAVNMGGRAAELVFFGETSTGASSDLRTSTDLAEKMVCQWGMSERVGPVTFARGEEHVFLGKKLAQEKTWSEEMAWIIDQEVEVIVREAEKNAIMMIEEHREKIEKIAEALLEREEITGAEVSLIIEGKELPPFEPRPKPQLPAPVAEGKGQAEKPS